VIYDRPHSAQLPFLPLSGAIEFPLGFNHDISSPPPRLQGRSPRLAQDTDTTDAGYTSRAVEYLSDTTRILFGFLENAFTI
jgi:hypothetical protein